jgi:DNA invertase Pin-like site-specific DNA recombinase
MNATPMAIYARVSTEQQAETHTIASQVAALRERVAADGLAGSAALEFLDEGYSGATLVRPALERLRDVVAAGSVDRLYVHSPDRLARKYASQVLLVDEFRRAGVEVIFLNRALGQSPEDDLLLQVQGMIAEYERAKIIERHRRGKRHAARAGGVNVLSGAPYGYRYVSKYAGGGQARYDIIPEEARVVRQVFDWIARDRLTIGEVCRRLTQAGEVTRTGKTAWDRSVLWGMLKNPAYIGNAAFGKTRQEPLCPRRSGSPSPSLPSSSPTCLPLSGNNFGRINVTRGNRAAVRCISCKVWCSASSVAMPIMEKASARGPGRASPARTRITAAWGRMRIALAASASVRIPRSGRICWTWPSGRKSVRCWPTRSDLRRNIGAACNRTPTQNIRLLRRWKSRSASCGKGSHASSTVTRRGSSTSSNLSPG